MKLSHKGAASGVASAMAPIEDDNLNWNGGCMETRITALELLGEKTLERIMVIEVDLAVIKSNYATREDIAKLKEDIAKLESTLLKWFVGTAVAIAGVAFTAAKLIR